MTQEQIDNIKNALEKYPERHDEIMLRWAAAMRLSEVARELGGTLGLFEAFNPKPKWKSAKNDNDRS